MARCYSMKLNYTDYHEIKLSPVITVESIKSNKFRVIK